MFLESRVAESRVIKISSTFSEISHQGYLQLIENITASGKSVISYFLIWEGDTALIIQ